MTSARGERSALLSRMGPCAATSSSTRSAGTGARAVGLVRAQADRGALYYCRYFELAKGSVISMRGELLNPRGDLGYMGFNVFRGDNRTFAVILLAPTADRELRALPRQASVEAACAAIAPWTS